MAKRSPTPVPPPAPLPLTLRFQRHLDGAVSLCAERAEGSATWQRQTGQRAAFFTRHDLTHFAVETVIGYQSAFYGLLAAGWDFADFGMPWQHRPLPPDAVASELLVGLFDTEGAGGASWTAAEFNEQTATFYTARGLLETPPILTDALIGAIRATRDDLFVRWSAVPTGGMLKLRFAVS